MRLNIHVEKNWLQSLGAPRTFRPPDFVQATEFDHSSFSRSSDMADVHQDLNGSKVKCIVF